MSALACNAILWSCREELGEEEEALAPEAPGPAAPEEPAAEEADADEEEPDTVADGDLEESVRHAKCVICRLACALQWGGGSCIRLLNFSMYPLVHVAWLF
jgi:hypothetical protein